MDETLVAADLNTEAFLFDRIIKQFIDLDGIKKGDPKAIEAAALKLADLLGYKAEAGELDDIVQEIFVKDYYGAGYELGDALMKFCGPRANPPRSISGPQIMTSVTADSLTGKRIEDLTHAEAVTWLGNNRETIKDGMGYRIVKNRFTKYPEIAALLSSEMKVGQVQALNRDEIIKRIEENIIPLLSKLNLVIVVVYPPAALAIGVVIAALKMIVQYYHQNNIDTGLSLEDFAVV